MMRIEDNRAYSKADFIKTYPKLSEKLVDKTISNLAEEINFFVFPK